MVMNVNMNMNMNMDMNMDKDKDRDKIKVKDTDKDKDMDKDKDRLLETFKKPECRTFRYPISPVPEWKKLTMPEVVRYRTKPTQSGIFWSGTGLN